MMTEYACDRTKCWATRVFYKQSEIPCNEPGIPPLYLCEQHDAEVRGATSSATQSVA